MIVLYPLVLVGHLYQFMVVGGEHGLGAQLPLVGAVLQHRAGDGHAVIGGGASSDFVQDQKTVWGSVPENVCHLVHFHHKGGFSA